MQLSNAITLYTIAMLLVVTSAGNYSKNLLNYRLPNNTEPTHYDVVLTTNVHTGERAFTGTVTIELKVITESRGIVLHARQLNINRASIRRLDDTNAQAQDMVFTYEETREFLTLTPALSNITLPKDTKWALTIKYYGTLEVDKKGFYVTTYIAEDNTTRYLAVTEFETSYSRQALPCYDEPAKRATFSISIYHSPTYHAISNMPVDETNSKAGVTVFQKSVPMSSYTVAFIVSDLKWIEGSLNNITQRVYTRLNNEHAQQWFLVAGMLITASLTDYFGIKFALPKLDQATLPFLPALAVENWGLITYKENLFFYMKEEYTMKRQTDMVITMAHEFTHQWFGNLVSIKWWTYLWLKESFATLYSYQAVDDVYPDWSIWQLFHIDEYQRALSMDAAHSSRAMTHYVHTPSEISKCYGTIPYKKGAAVLLMWQHALTEHVFHVGLHNYLSANLYSSVDEWQLFEAIQIAVKEENYEIPENISTMMASWTQQGGYPLLTVKRNYDDGSFTVQQAPFYNDENFKQDKKWYIPFNYVVQSKPDFRDTRASHYLLNVSTLSVIDANISKTDWLILNKQSIGYYRINYDLYNWYLIVKGLVTKPYKIHARNKAQLMQDAYYFCISQRLSYRTLLNLLTYLKNEDQFAPWSTANTIIINFNRYLSGDFQYDNFKLYVSKLVSNIYDKLGSYELDGEPRFQKYVRIIAINLACLAGVENCLKATNDQIIEFVKNNKTIEPNLQSAIFCNGIKTADDEIFDTIYNLMMKTSDQKRKRLYISALGCAQQQHQLMKFIESSIDRSNSLGTQERVMLLKACYSQSEMGLLTSIEFLKENWQAYAKLASNGSNPVDAEIRQMAQFVVNIKQNRKILSLIAKVTDYYKPTDLEKSVVAIVDANKNWLSKNRDPIMDWLSRYRLYNDARARTSISAIAVTVTLLVTRLL